MSKENIYIYFPVGTVVFDVRKGNTRGVVSSHNPTELYPVNVHFNDGTSQKYLSDGREYIEDKIPMLHKRPMTLCECVVGKRDF